VHDPAQPFAVQVEQSLHQLPGDLLGRRVGERVHLVEETLDAGYAVLGCLGVQAG
jgi:hypothetical protein